MRNPATDLRSFIDILRSNGRLVDDNEVYDSKFELGRRLNDIVEQGKAVYFNAVKNSTIPVVGGLFSSHFNVALGLNCAVDELSELLGDAPNTPISPCVHNQDARCHEVITIGAEALSKLPVPVHAPKDAGRFINAGVSIARDPKSGRHNLSYQRFQLRKDGTIGVHINRWRDLGEFLHAAELRGENLPLCIAVGLEPALMLAASYKYEGDEYEIAGSLRDSPVPVVNATTCDILIPAMSEIIIECEIVAGQREPEGPMAEYTGHYSGVEIQPIANIKAITHSLEPIFQTIAGASREHLLLGTAVTREPLIKKRTLNASPRVQNVYLAPYASGFLAIIKMETPEPGEVRNVGIAALSCHVNVITVIVVDSDIDIYRESDILWALSTRVRWGEDLMVLTGILSNELHPASDTNGVLSKVVIDATLTSDQRKDYSRVHYNNIE